MNNATPSHAELERDIGYRFKDPALLRLALTHPSARSELNLDDDNQRLEFIGDAVLGLLAAEYGYTQFREMDEGDLTVLRSSVTRTATLSEVGRALGLGAHLILGHGEAANGGADRARNLADAAEALVGAVYLDGGLPSARIVFERLFAPRIDPRPDTGAANPKGLLQELVMKRGWPMPDYAVVTAEGPSHQRHFTIRVRIGNEHEATGTGRSKQAAEVDAAARMLAKLQ